MVSLDPIPAGDAAALLGLIITVMIAPAKLRVNRVSASGARYARGDVPQLGRRGLR